MPCNYRSETSATLRKSLERPQAWMRLWALNNNEWARSDHRDDWRADAVTQFKRQDSDIPLYRIDPELCEALCDELDAQAARIMQLEAQVARLAVFDSRSAHGQMKPSI